MKRGIRSILIIGVLTVIASHATYSIFTAEGKIAGNYFSTGRADLALLKNPALGVTESNLTTTLPGFVFNNITDNWQQQIGVKVVNKGDLVLQLLLAAQSSEPATTPNLKDVINVKIFRWFDNGDGVVQATELGSETETKLMTYWLNSPFTLGILPPNEIGSYVVQFEVGSLNDTYQDQAITVDFVFDATVAQ